MRIGSLFSGIGLLDLGVWHGLRAGGVTAEVVWQIEHDEFPRTVLERTWPGASRRVTDVRMAHAHYESAGGHRFVGGALEAVDCMVGGFPCQDLSVAGLGKGLDGERSGLWWHFWRLIRELRPRYVLLENVPAITVRGLGDVLGSLAVLGYDAEWCRFGADDVGFPHKRKRWWCVAVLADAERHLVREQQGGQQGAPTHGRFGLEAPPLARGDGSSRQVAHAIGERLEGKLRAGAADWPGPLAVGGLGRAADGVPPWMEWTGDPATRGLVPRAIYSPLLDKDQRRLNKNRLKALGNGVVPRCAYELGFRLSQHIRRIE